jgi:hypothetical protein
MGSQQSTSFNAPFAFNGYSVVPRRISDISLNTGDTIANFSLINPVLFAPVEVNVDTARVLDVACQSARIVRGVGTVRYGILIDESNGDFSVPLALFPTNNGGTDTIGSLSFGQIGALVPWLGEGDTVYLKVRMVANFNTVSKLSVQERLIKVYKTRLVGVYEWVNGITITIYPNPASDRLNIETNAKIESLMLFDMQGKTVLESTNMSDLDVSQLIEGVYILTVKTDAGIMHKRIQVKR